MPSLVKTAIVVRKSKKVTLDPSNIPAGDVSVETFTVKGLKTTDVVLVQAQSLESGLAIIKSRASAADTLELTIWNFSGSAVNPASQTFRVLAL